ERGAVIGVACRSDALHHLRFRDAGEERSDLLADGGSVGTCERYVVGDDALLRAAAGSDEDQVLADGVESFVQLRAGAIAGRNHGDDGTNADDDAEAGQDRTPLVDQQGRERNADGGEKTHKTSKPTGRGPRDSCPFAPLRTPFVPRTTSARAAPTRRW